MGGPPGTRTTAIIEDSPARLKARLEAPGTWGQRVPAQRRSLCPRFSVAHADGLTPVVEDDSTVDLRLEKDGEVVAAIHGHLGWDGSSTFEYPARRGPGPITNPEHHPWGNGLFHHFHMRDLDRWWAQVSGTGRVWRTRPLAWAQAGYWQKRLGHDFGPGAALDRAAA